MKLSNNIGMRNISEIHQYQTTKIKKTKQETEKEKK